MTLREAVLAAKSEEMNDEEIYLQRKLEKFLKKRAHKDLAPYFENVLWVPHYNEKPKLFDEPCYSLRVEIENLMFEFGPVNGFESYQWMLRQVPQPAIPARKDDPLTRSRYTTIHTLADIQL